MQQLLSLKQSDKHLKTILLTECFEHHQLHAKKWLLLKLNDIIFVDVRQQSY